MNKVCLMGRLTTAPELKTTQNGTAVTSFGLAVDRFWNGERSTDFFTIVAWQKTAELAVQYLEKGRQVGVSGRLQYRKWQDKEGKPHSKVEVVAEQLDFLSSQKEADNGPDLVSSEGDDGQLPF